MNEKNMQTALEEAATYTVVPLSETLILDAETPISILFRFLDQDELFLLEGILGSIKHDRHSYLGFDAYVTITCFFDRVELQYSDGRKEHRMGSPFDVLREVLQMYRAPVRDAERYLSGIIGYLTYECMTAIETIPLPAERMLGMPLAKFAIPRNLIVCDNVDRSVTVVRNVFVEEAMQREAHFDQEKKTLQRLVAQVCTPLPVPVPPLRTVVSDELRSLTSHVSWEQFAQRTEACKEYIKAGDIFQIQISRRMSCPCDVSGVELYRRLRHLNPSPFMFFFKEGENALVGASPELLVKVEDGVVTHRPIAGTRKRYSEHRSEEAIIQELLTNEKERAEHVMLVDLARNDIGRVAQYGSVHVDELMIIEKYSHVVHMVSNAIGTLRPSADALDALMAAFPAGTVTGAPKVRAMEIIAELETMQREFYSGGVVFFDFQGNLKSALTIRSLYLQEGVCHTQAAAGIVYDSIVEQEYKETENKMRACTTVMATVHGGGTDA